MYPQGNPRSVVDHETPSHAAVAVTACQKMNMQCQPLYGFAGLAAPSGSGMGALPQVVQPVLQYGTAVMA